MTHNTDPRVEEILNDPWLSPLFDPEPSKEMKMDALRTMLASYRTDLIGELFKIESEKWRDAEHCTCLGYAIVQLAGGEDSEEGKKWQAKLLATHPNHHE